MTSTKNVNRTVESIESIQKYLEALIWNYWKYQNFGTKYQISKPFFFRKKFETLWCYVFLYILGAKLIHNLIILLIVDKNRVIVPTILCYFGSVEFFTVSLGKEKQLLWGNFGSRKQLEFARSFVYKPPLFQVSSLVPLHRLRSHSAVGIIFGFPCQSAIV